MNLSQTEKLARAIKILRPDTAFTIRGNEATEEIFNNIEWITGVDEIGSATFTTTCPYSEITWTAVQTEMDKL